MANSRRNDQTTVRKKFLLDDLVGNRFLRLKYGATSRPIFMTIRLPFLGEPDTFFCHQLRVDCWIPFERTRLRPSTGSIGSGPNDEPFLSIAARYQMPLLLIITIGTYG